MGQKPFGILLVWSVTSLGYFPQHILRCIKCGDNTWR